MCETVESLSAGARAQQVVWMTRLLMEENPPGQTWFEDESRAGTEAFDVALATQEFARLLCRGDVAERMVAVRALAWLRDAGAVKPLVAALGDSEAAVRVAALHGVADLDPLPGWCVPSVERCLEDPDPAVRSVAVRVLSSPSTRQAGEMLARMLDDDAACVVLAAIDAFERLGRDGVVVPAASAKMSCLLVGDDPLIAYAAFWALGWVSGTEGIRSAFRLSDWGRQVWATVVEA